MLQIFLLVVVILNIVKVSSALGVSPAKTEINFQQGLEKSIDYTVFSVDSEKELELYVKGDLAKYVKLDKSKLIGKGKFTATLKLPESIKKPGRHTIIVGVKEKIDEESVAQVVGTSVIIQAIIVVNVPYPGKYLELALKSCNVNVGEPVNFELEISSKGSENVNITPRIEIISQNKTLETLYFKNREIKSQEVMKLKKTLNTTNYNPGKYSALAIVDYGEIARAESIFNIGELIIYITNYTKQIVIEKIKAFDIEIESGWNNKIDGAYAEVFILDNSKSLIGFKTSSTDLIPWERKTITGYFDTSNFTKGFYDANITLIYYGKDRGKSSSKLVKIEFIEKQKINYVILAFCIGIILLLAIIILLIKKNYIKRTIKKSVKERIL